MARWAGEEKTFLTCQRPPRTPSSHRQRWKSSSFEEPWLHVDVENTRARAGRFQVVFQQNGSCKLHIASRWQEQATQANGEEDFGLHKLLQSKAKDMASTVEPGCYKASEEPGFASVQELLCSCC